MSWVHVLVAAGAAAGVGTLLLLCLWPSREKGRRVLTRWGLVEPTNAEIDDAVVYLRCRRVCYPWVFFAVSAVFTAISRNGGTSLLSAILVTLVLGALLAELWAQRRSRGTPRSAVLVQRQVTDLVPAWALVVVAVLVAAVSVTQIGALVDADWAVSTSPLGPGWVLGCALALGVAGPGIAWLSVRRPAAGQDRADRVLRARSARVAVGLVIALTGALYSDTAYAPGPGLPSGVVLVAAIACWLVVVRRPRTPAPATA